MSDDIDVPKWDVALEGLIKEEAKKLGRGLRLDDFIRLATENAIRFDDIIVDIEHAETINANLLAKYGWDERAREYAGFLRTIRR